MTPRRERLGPLDARVYGTADADLVLLHGGPGAPGTMVPLARALCARFRVIEPLQRRSEAEPLTVARHVQDLAEVLAHTGRTPVALIGHSWGAMLALAFLAAHPEAARSLVLVGCGTFSDEARVQLRANREARVDVAAAAERDRIIADEADPDERLTRLGAFYERADSLEPVDAWREAGESCDQRGHEETWADMLRLQASGAYPAAFAAIRVPALMLHGADDPHPGRMIHASLATVMPGLELIELGRCGHVPWIERHGRGPFLEALDAWLARLER